jgi:Plant mobile domain
LGPVPTDDPLGIGRPVVRTARDPPAQDSICFPGFDHETYLTAFLAWWICYFLIPSTPAFTIRRSVFVMASRIAKGHRVSLAVPVLANIYRSLRGLVTSRDPSGCREMIPHHFICGWLHMHFAGLYQPAALSESMMSELPLLASIAGTTATSFSGVGARHIFHRCGEHFRTTSTRLSTLYSGRLIDRVIIDEIPQFRGGSGIMDRRDD